MISVALMGHPKRQPFIDRLAEQLPEAEVVLDRHNDRWETGRRSLLAYDPAATHQLVVQDDALLCRDLVAGVGRAAEVAGERPISLYTGKVRPHQKTIAPAVRQARREGIPWISGEGPLWGVGIVVPVAHIPDLVAACDAMRIENYDRRIGAFYIDQEIHCWYTVPSLVDHRPVDENPSLVAGRTGNRRAHWFIGEEKSALDIDWSAKPVPVKRLKRFRHSRSNAEVLVRTASARCRRMEQDPRWIEEPPRDADEPHQPRVRDRSPV